MTAEPRDECSQCGGPLPPPTRVSGRQRRYCSDACRAAAYRARKPGPDARRAHLVAALDQLDQVGLRYLVDQLWAGVPYSATATERALREVEAARQAEREWAFRIVREGARAATTAAAAPANRDRAGVVTNSGHPGGPTGTVPAPELAPPLVRPAVRRRRR